MATLKYDSITGFTGMNIHTSPFLMKVGELALSKNYSSKKVGSLIKTGDYQLKNAQITDNYSILGGIDFLRASGTHTHIVACDGASNAEIYEDVTGTWTSAIQALTAGYKVRFAYSPALDSLFAVNYVDATRSYNGSTWSTTTNVTDAPKGKSVISFGDRIYILNAVVSGTSYPTRAYRSSTVETGSITWDTTNDWITFDDVVVGASRVADNMLIVCENSCHMFTLGDEKYKIAGIGGVSADAIAEHDEYTFFASLSGMYATNGSTPQKISLPIQELWDNIPYANFANMSARILNDYLYVYVGDITVPETIANCLLEYDINQNDWNFMSLSNEIKHLHTFVGSSGRKLYAGDDDGNVFEMFASESQNTALFESVVETNWFYGSDPKIIDTFKELWLFSTNVAGLSVQAKIDNDDTDWIPIGEFSGTTDYVKFNLRGVQIKFRLTEHSKGNMHEIHNLTIGYIPGVSNFEDTTK